MTAKAPMRRSVAKITCSRCGNVLIVPDQSYDFSEDGLIVNLWSCPKCGNKFESADRIEPVEADRKAKMELPKSLVA